MTLLPVDLGQLALADHLIVRLLDHFPVFSIVMARHALFPETILDSAEMTVGEDGEDVEAADGEGDEDIDALLATLQGWNADGDETKSESSTSSFSFESTSYGDVLTDELQDWRQQNIDTPYDQWSDEKKQKFNVSSAFVFFYCFREVSSAILTLYTLFLYSLGCKHSSLRWFLSRLSVQSTSRKQETIFSRLLPRLEIVRMSSGTAYATRHPPRYSSSNC